MFYPPGLVGRHNETIPQHFNLLPEPDKIAYRTLQITLNPGPIIGNKWRPPDSFEDNLRKIRLFVERGDENDWKRYLVCGICWLDNGIAINTRQLKLLLSKCKSSINGSLLKMGYSTDTTNTGSKNALFSKIPLLKGNFNELRQWTFRMKTSGSSLASNQSEPLQIIKNPISVPGSLEAYSPGSLGLSIYAPNPSVPLPLSPILSISPLRLQPGSLPCPIISTSIEEPSISGQSSYIFPPKMREKLITTQQNVQ